MNRLFFLTAFLLGAGAVVWVASTFIGSNNFALGVTLVIAAVYFIGFIELIQYRAATATLTDALATLPQQVVEDIELEQWLSKLDPTLGSAVALRIQGERMGLPAPVITPYLVGLLVMLGLLGTFMGMVETLSGAVIALEATTELQAIRAGLAEPIGGLSVAFGTSVAGVAASAMLGLISTVTRRDRMLATQVLDRAISTVFRSFSLTQNRQETYKALQMQAQVLPEVAQNLNSVAEKVGEASEHLSRTLLARQQEFHEAAQSSYSELATSVDQSLRVSLTDSGRLAGESIRPIVEQTMAQLNHDALASQKNLTEIVQRQLETLSESFGSTSESVSAAWRTGLDAHAVSGAQLLQAVTASLDELNGKFEDRALSLLDSLTEATSNWVKQQEIADVERLTLWTASLNEAQQLAQAELGVASKQFTSAMAESARSQQDSLHSASATFESMSGAVTAQWERATEQIEQLNVNMKMGLENLHEAEEQRAAAALDRLGGLEATVASHLTKLGKEMEAPMVRLIETASETPRAAAEVIGKLREEVSNNIERDNQLLEERQRIMEQLESLSRALQQTSTVQAEALQNMVSSSGVALEKIGEKFDQQVSSRVLEMSGVAEHFSGSATEMASLGEAFTAAVSLFSESNSQLTDTLGDLERSLAKASDRGDDQMQYYVAQARQIIDQSMASQKEIFDELRHFSSKQLTVDEEAG